MVDHYIKDKAGIEQKVVFHMTRVILISDHYGKGSSDPVWGTGLACVGTAVGISKDSEEPIRVDWDNNRTNIYHPDHLQVYSGKEVGENPNFTFKRAKKTADHRPAYLAKRVSEMKAKYGKAMKEMDDTESESVMTEKERKEALDLINSTKDTKKEEGKVNKKMSYFNNYMSKPVASTDDDEDEEDKKSTVAFNDEYNGEYDDGGYPKEVL